VTTKTVAPDAITANEAAFGTPIVSETEPTDYLKAGANWFNPDTGEQKIYDTNTNNFIDVTAVDATARASADGKNTIYRQDAQPTGGTYVTGDTWFDSNDNNRIYRYNGTAWVALQLGGNALADISANSINTGTLNANLITVSNLDVGTMTTGNLSATRIDAGTISASVTMTSPTLTSGVISTNTVTSASTVSSGNPRVTIANQYLSQSTSGVGIVIDTGAGYLPGGINAEANFSGTTSDIAIYGQLMNSTVGSRGVIVLHSGALATSGYVSIGVTNLNNSAPNTLMITNTYATLSAGSSPAVYGLRNIQCVTSFTAASDTTGVNGDVTLVYTP
jgi:hypothetical protein